MLVAMKGHPGCGKSTLARSLAKALRWPLLDKDDIRDCTRPLHLALSAFPSKHDAGEVLLNTMAYQVLWRLAETQLKMGLSIIVDSPLSRPSLLGSAAALAAAHHCRLIIIECLPSDAQAWRHRLESRVAASENAIADVSTPIDSNGVTMSPQEDYGCAGWHKPGCWEDLQALIQNYRGCNEYNVPAPARKLVVDTTAPLSADALHAEVLSWLLSVSDDTPLVSYIPCSG